MKLLKCWFDLETTGLEADWDNIIAIGYQVEGEPVKVLQIDDYKGWKPWDDKRLIQEFLLVLQRPDIGCLIGHNITLFDKPYLQARMARNRLGVIPAIPLIDTYFILKSKLRISRKSLDNAAEFLGCPYKKTPLRPEVWRRAARGDRKALALVGRDHCKMDIKVTRWLYEQLAPMMMRHPVMGGYYECHNCRSKNVKRWGYYPTTNKGRQVRFYCKDCGAPGHMPEKEWVKAFS